VPPRVATRSLRPRRPFPPPWRPIAFDSEDVGGFSISTVVAY
jgi:hypothetical protein